MENKDICAIWKAINNITSYTCVSIKEISNKIGKVPNRGDLLKVVGWYIKTPFTVTPSN